VCQECGKFSYLLQHVYNPVDWFPWTEEAFVKPKTEDKPIFLRIGYSIYNWCHVTQLLQLILKLKSLKNNGLSYFCIGF